MIGPSPPPRREQNLGILSGGKARAGAVVGRQANPTTEEPEKPVFPNCELTRVRRGTLSCV